MPNSIIMWLIVPKIVPIKPVKFIPTTQLFAKVWKFRQIWSRWSYLIFCKLICYTFQHDRLSDSPIGLFWQIALEDPSAKNSIDFTLCQMT